MKSGKIGMLETFAVVLSIVFSGMGIFRSAVPAPTPVNVVVKIGDSEKQTIQAVIFSADYCTPCRHYIDGKIDEKTKKKTKLGIKDTMPSAGWLIRDSKDADMASAHIVINKDAVAARNNGVESLPTTIIFRNGKEVRRAVGGMSGDALADWINSERTKEVKP